MNRLIGSMALCLLGIAGVAAAYESSARFYPDRRDPLAG
jgi:hypothetical protein